MSAAQAPQTMTVLQHSGLVVSQQLECQRQGADTITFPSPLLPPVTMIFIVFSAQPMTTGSFSQPLTVEVCA